MLLRNYAIAVVALGLGFCASTFGAIIAYTDGGTAGNHVGDTSVINIGREFSVSNTGITVDDLGIYAEDASGNPLTLSASHDVTLFSIGTAGVASPSNTELASANVPAGSSAPYQSGFRFASIAPTYLPPGNYAVIAYGLDNGNEGYGDGGGRLSSANANDLVFDPYQFTSDASPAFPNNGDGNDHNGASFLFDVGNTTPEPASLSFLAVAGIGLLAHRRRAGK